MTDTKKDTKSKVKPKAAKEVKAEPKAKVEKYYYALGRRKTAVATVRLFESKGTSTVNGMDLKQYFPLKSDQKVVNGPLILLEKLTDFYFTSKVKGGGKKAQREAISLGIARAFVKSDETLKATLRKASFMTRDDRMVERKKTGKVKARKSHQFSKR
ncbi:30S ribosomal protein S9 [Candidatus Dojkabacteria bacterium]|uniref:30S ribosomal protein S9 n=1 Tax=Candidatus Dojkabacteria bacterium TaxID=2099670 RepID=A0A955I926_9BACT|nr:30S ribosomal protein S9 [Candidatus Dojkabacteria bacterium]MCB0749689.1 30S ribosomal protein S9 [Ignavibacteriota bacterium]